eukprot:Hpha_TRINITY_DN10810_c1_g1::TRINITY_DN10810_c1_g1_i1::g.23416::m.23416
MADTTHTTVWWLVHPEQCRGVYMPTPRQEEWRGAEYRAVRRHGQWQILGEDQQAAPRQDPSVSSGNLPLMVTLPRRLWVAVGPSNPDLSSQVPASGCYTLRRRATQNPTWTSGEWRIVLADNHWEVRRRGSAVPVAIAGLDTIPSKAAADASAVRLPHNAGRWRCNGGISLSIHAGDKLPAVLGVEGPLWALPDGEYEMQDELQENMPCWRRRGSESGRMLHSLDGHWTISLLDPQGSPGATLLFSVSCHGGRMPHSYRTKWYVCNGEGRTERVAVTPVFGGKTKTQDKKEKKPLWAPTAPREKRAVTERKHKAVTDTAVLSYPPRPPSSGASRGAASTPGADGRDGRRRPLG